MPGCCTSYCVPSATEVETLYQKLNDVATGSNSGIVLSSSELPVPATAPILGSNSDLAHAPSEHVSVSVPMPQLQVKCIVQVHRLNNKKDLTDIFLDPLIMSHEIKMIVIDARGVEEVASVGLLRDVFSLFWKETYDSLFAGQNELVSFVRHHCRREKWVAVGRILAKGYLTFQY